MSAEIHLPCGEQVAAPRKRNGSRSDGELPSRGGAPAAGDDDAANDDDSWPEEGPDPIDPTWDDFDLEELDDEPDPEDGDFWIDPDELTDPWN